MTRKELEKKKGVKLAQREASPAEALLTVQPEEKEEKTDEKLKAEEQQEVKSEDKAEEKTEVKAEDKAEGEDKAEAEPEKK